MSRNGSGVYSLPAGSTVTNGDTSDATDLNTPLADLEADMNIPRPVVAGGTGASSAAAALINLGLTATAAEINVLDGITATVTELNYTDGVTSAIQTQLNTLSSGKQAAGATLTSLEGLSLVAGDNLYATAADTLARLPIGTAGQAYVVNAGATAPEWGSSVAPQTAVTASGQANIDFTGIPSWVNRVTVTGSGLSVSGTGSVSIQLGDSGGFETTNYLGNVAVFVNAGVVSVNALSSGFILFLGAGEAGAVARHFTMTLNRHTGNTWSASSIVTPEGTLYAGFTAGSKTLSDVLTQVRITTSSGTFDLGTVSVSWE